jgi:tRNA (guanosine-2'-O-)-methyltransferase
METYLQGNDDNATERSIIIRGENCNPSDIIDILAPFLTPERKVKIAAVAAQRTMNAAVVCENVDDVGNVFAVMRTAENLGLQRVHMIGGEKKKTHSRISQGCDKWLDVFRWSNAADCVEHLRGNGYKVVATSCEKGARPFTEIDFTVPVAMVFGNEKDGVSKEMLACADETCWIPTVGQSQSFNISVAAAIILHHVFMKRVEKNGRQGDLSDIEREFLMARFYMKSVKGAEGIIRNHLLKNSTTHFIH